ncbi:hypothetical protein ACWDBD_19500 [Streptomyces sp. NPDC001118]
MAGRRLDPVDADVYQGLYQPLDGRRCQRAAADESVRMRGQVIMHHSAGSPGHRQDDLLGAGAFQLWQRRHDLFHHGGLQR